MGGDETERLKGRYACRFCQHDQYEHNLDVGCPFCRCMATPGEADARTDVEMGLTILPPNDYVAGYRPKADHVPPDAGLREVEPYEHPGFIFSGANMGGQSLQTCLECSALVQESGTPAHRAWHERAGG